MASDSTFEFEKKRNVPEKYNREVVQQTIKAMKKVEEIKEKRQKLFYDKRMQVKKKVDKQEALQDIDRNIDIIQSPLARMDKDSVPKIKLPAKTKNKEATQMQIE